MKRVLVIPKYKLHQRNFIEYECGIDYDKSITIEYQEEFKEIIEEIKTFDEAYFVDFCDEYRKILPMIPFKTKCYSILTNEIGEFTNPVVLNIFNASIEFYDRLIFKEILTISYELATVLKNSGYQAEKLNYTIDDKIEKNKAGKEKVVGIICDDYNPNNNFYNILTALCMTKAKKIKLVSHMAATLEFIERFELPVEFCEDIFDVINNSTINILVNFTANKVELLRQSLKMNIPCLIGNFDSDFISKYNKELVINSDDDVNEIAEKINKCLEGKK